MAVDILSKLNTNGSGLNLRELATSLTAAEIAPLQQAQTKKAEAAQLSLSALVAAALGNELPANLLLNVNVPVPFWMIAPLPLIVPPLPAVEPSPVTANWNWPAFAWLKPVPWPMKTAGLRRCSNCQRLSRSQSAWPG